MRHRIDIITVAAFLLLIAGGVAWSDESPCAMCHDDVAAQMARTAHGMTEGFGAGCQDCHGDGTAHMDAEGDPSLIDQPDPAACRSCHDQLTRQPTLPSREVHNSQGVDCFACHSIHDTAIDRQPLLKQPVETLCVDCHRDQKARLSRPYGHRLDRPGMVTCVSCHDPHGDRSSSALKEPAGESPCFSCHAEKRGPFVFNHGPRLAGDCMSCHEPHGSNNPNALIRSRVDQLCFECHSPISGETLGSQPPSIHDLRSPRYRQCTVCHVAIHGSNTAPALTK